jgi:hypothetical protein
MKRLGLLVLSLAVVVAFGAMSASGVWAKPVLELKEEGVPVAAGAEVGVELETPEFSHCKWAQRAHVSVNGAKQAKLAVEPLKEDMRCPEGGGIAFADVSGGVRAIAMAVAGSAKLKGSPLRLTFVVVVGPENTCAYDFRRFSGSFPIPGQAVIEGSAVGKLNRRRSTNAHPESPCEQSATTSFTVALRGHNNQLLETELVG